MLITHGEVKDEAGFERQILGLEVGKTHICPNCSSERKNNPKHKVFKVFQNADSIGFNCAHCGVAGIIPNSKNEIKPQRELAQATDPVLSYFKERGIDRHVVEYCKVKEVNGVIAFPYYDHGVLTGIKYRRREKKDMWMEPGSKLSFWLYDFILRDRPGRFDELIITEGEVDAMSWIQAGRYNVWSVPAGASETGNQGDKINYALQQAGNSLKQFKKIYIATDDDKAGDALAEELAERLGKRRCWRIRFKRYGCKDSNQLLVQNGTEGLIRAYEEASLWPMEGILDHEGNKALLDQIFQEGMPYIPDTNFSSAFNKHLKIVEGQFNIFTGIPNHGKTAFALMLMVDLAVHRGWKWGIYSPEQAAPKTISGKKIPMDVYLFNHIASILIGKEYLSYQDQYGKIIPSDKKLSHSEYKAAWRFYKEHFFIITPERGEATLDSLIDYTQYLYLKEGIKGLLLDPYNRIDHRSNSNDKLEYIEAKLKQINYLKEDTGITIFMTAHPTKILGTRKVAVSGQDIELPRVPTLYDISGSANFRNMVDNGIVVYRNMATKMVEIYIQKVKFDIYGTPGAVEMNFDPDTRRYYDLKPNKSPLINIGIWANVVDQLELAF